MSSTLRNGETRDLNLTASDYITLVAVSGTYTATVVRGNSSGTVLGTNVTGGTYGPYTGGAVIRVATSASSEVDFDIGASPVIVSDTFVTATTNPVTGRINLLAGTKDAGVFKRPVKQRPLVLTADAPTITYSATAPASGRAMLPNLPNVRPAGCALSYDTSLTVMTIIGGAGFAGIDCIHNGTSLTLGWKCNTATAERLMFWVDGYPVSLTPATPSVSTTLAGYCYVTLTFIAAARRRIEILGTNFNALLNVVVPYTDSVEPAPARRKVHIIGDSFQSGSNAITSNTQLPTSQIAMRYDCSVSADGLGGTGYVEINGGFGVFGTAARVAIATAIQPDDIVFMGSVNDDASNASVQAAATACYAAYQVACPYTEITVFGPQATNSTDTLSANRKANCLAVRAAAANAGLRYNEMCGYVDSATIPAWASFTFYAPAQLVTNRGSIWRHDATVSTQYPGIGAPGSYSYPQWTLMSTDMFGTGRVGTTASDGTRDTFLYSDAIHPMPVYCAVLGERMITAVADINVNAT